MKEDQTSRSIEMEFELPHSPDLVWRALTEPELLSQWLLPVFGLELEPGAQFTFKAAPQPGWDGVVACEYLEIEPPSRISWRWVVGNLDTVVSIRLSATGHGTSIFLSHSGFTEEQNKNEGGARYGWKLMTAKLVELLDDLSLKE